MSDKLFDSFIQEKMQQHVSQVPADMWQRIMNEKDRRDKAFWFRKWYAVAALLVLMLGSAAVYYYFNNGTVEDNGTVQQTIPNNNNNSKKSENVLPSASDNQNETSTSNIVDPSKKSEKEDLRSENNDDNGTGNNIDLNTTANKGFRFDKNRFVNVTENKASKATDKNSLIALNDVDETADAFKHYDQGSIIQRENNFNNNSLSNYLKTLTGKGIPITACPTDKAARNQAFYLEAYVSPDYAWKKTSGTNTSLLNSKDSAETMLVSYSAGLRFAKPIGNHVMLKAGIQYSQINEKFKIRTENERKTVTIITTRTVQTSPGVFTSVADTSSYEQIGYVTKTSVNKYKNIDIPVLLSYEWGNEDIRFAVTGGSVINIHSASKGRTYDSSGTAVSYDKSNNIYKTNTGVGLYGSVSIIKPVGENTEIFAEPYMRYNLSNMTKESAGFSQKFNAAGINLGVRINIGRQRY